MEKKFKELLWENEKKVASFDFKEDTMLLVVDIQPKLFAQLDKVEEMVKNSHALIRAFKEFGIKVIATEQYPKGLGHTDEKIKEVLGDSPIFEKTSFDSITEEVYHYIEKTGVKNVVIVGAEAHVCVYQTIRHLILGGKNVFAIEDAITSFSQDLKRSGLNAARDMGAFIGSTEMVLFDLCEDSKNPHFKFISNLVKEIRQN